MSDGSVTREERFGDIDETSVATDLTPKFCVAATLCVDRECIRSCVKGEGGAAYLYRYAQ